MHAVGVGEDRLDHVAVAARQPDRVLAVRLFDPGVPLANRGDRAGLPLHAGEQDVVVTEFVTLDTLLTDADVSFADGDSLSFVCDDGPYTKFNPTYKDITEGKYYFKDGKAEEVPAALALVWGVGAAADGTVADIAKTAKEAGLRFVCGTTEADFTEEKAAGKRMPSGVLELIVVSAAKAEEKPAEE